MTESSFDAALARRLGMTVSAMNLSHTPIRVIDPWSATSQNPAEPDDVMVAFSMASSVVDIECTPLQSHEVRSSSMYSLERR